MEAVVWSNPGVLDLMKRGFVVTSLYVDDRTRLDSSLWYTSPYDSKVKKTIGQQNADLQITRYGNNAQPYYLILNPGGEILAGPRAYNLDVQDFYSFLKRGIESFEKKEVKI